MYKKFLKKNNINCFYNIKYGKYNDKLYNIDYSAYSSFYYKSAEKELINVVDDIIFQMERQTKMARNEMEKTTVLYLYAYSRVNLLKYEHVYNSCFYGLKYCRPFSASNEFIKYFERKSKTKDEIIYKVSLYNPDHTDIHDIPYKILRFFPDFKNNKYFETKYTVLYNIGKKRHIMATQGQILHFYNIHYSLNI